MGGSTENSGIMDGMRSRFENGGDVEQILKQLDERAPAPNFGRSAFLRDFGLNLLATPPQGNIFQTAAIAARDPVTRYNQAKAQSAANRREIMAALLGQEREQALEMEKLDKQ